MSPAALSLAPAHPRPGQRATLGVAVRNLGATVLPAGARVTLRLTLSGKTRTRVLRTVRSLSSGETATLSMALIAPASAAQVAASAGQDPARVAVLGGPLGPQRVGITPDKRAGQIVVDWVPARDHDISGYRIYRGVPGGQPLALVGLATGRIWVDTAAQRGISYRYYVTAVDRQGRESPLAQPASAMLQ